MAIILQKNLDNSGTVEKMMNAKPVLLTIEEIQGETCQEDSGGRISQSIPTPIGVINRAEWFMGVLSKKGSPCVYFRLTSTGFPEGWMIPRTSMSGVDNSGWKELLLVCKDTPPKTIMTGWKIHHEWRCTSYWTCRIFQPVMLVFRGVAISPVYNVYNLFFLGYSRGGSDFPIEVGHKWSPYLYFHGANQGFPHIEIIPT